MSPTLNPLTPAARAALRWLLTGPKPRQEINSGVVDRLQRGSLVDSIQLGSPYKTRKGLVEHLQLTPAGRLEADKRDCHKCGCTDDCACRGGCWWIGPNLCSSCKPRRLVLP
jgi:hypothetical protein